MNEILDEENPRFKKFSLKKYKITPFLILGSILKLISIVAFVFALLNELIGKGTKGTFTVIVISIFVFGITQIVLFVEKEIITEENKQSVIIAELLIMLVLFLMYPS